MVSAELLRRYPFFAGLSHEYLTRLAKISDEISVDAEHYFFHEEEDLDKFYLTLEGAIAIVIELPEKDVQHKVSEQFLRELKTKDVIVSTVGSGDIFGWSGLVPPYKSTAGAKAVTDCRVVAIQSQELRNLFEEDCKFGLVMTQKAAQIIRERLRDLRTETLSFIVQ
ncbi:MAG: cyclic nucleotide-binding domain-containing protein [Candidatus Promineifilaceae bacterium]|jgi:CRP/FNR family cyclic AMP-dependent transcriptional regulator